MTGNILFVDDEPGILEGFKRLLRKQFKIETAVGGEAGIKAILSKGPFAVVVSDLRMPGMDGVQFLAKVRENAADCVRIMLTGQADMESAIAAVNEGNIFRFLTKPCPPDILTKVLETSLKQFHLITAERELMEKTLIGSVKVLTEIMSLINPAVFSRISHIKHYVQHIASKLKLKDSWRFEIAAMLSQIGTVTLTPEILAKMYTGQSLSDKEKKMFASHPSVGFNLLSNIPRLESIAQMVKEQQKHITEYTMEELKNRETIASGAQILKVVLDFDELIVQGKKAKEALEEMFKRGIYNQSYLLALDDITTCKTGIKARDVKIDQLKAGMIADEDIKAGNGLLLLPKGQEITSMFLKRLINISGNSEIVETFRVLL